MKCGSPSDVRLGAVFVVCMLLAALACTHHPELRLRTFVNDALGLREGARVRVQGVELGKVTAVRVRPQPGKAPVEIDMLLQPTYELRIPTDAKVRLETEGVLGPTFAEIDIQSASGPPAADEAELTAEEQPQPKLDQLTGKVAEAIRKPCKDVVGHPSSVRPQLPKATR